MWWLLPLGGDSGDANPGAGASTSTPAARTAATPTTHTTAPAAQSPRRPGPARCSPRPAIRSVIKELEKETGRDRFGDFTVYEEYAIAQLMVNGSNTKYDTYTYRPGRGCGEGHHRRFDLISGDQPIGLDGFDWDSVPALLKEADKKLNVDDPENRYLVVKLPSDTFDTPAGMAVYLSDGYGSGYLAADTQGRVTRVFPAQD